MNKAEKNFLAFLETMKHATEVAAERMNAMSDEQKEAILNKYIRKAKEKEQKNEL